MTARRHFTIGAAVLALLLIALVAGVFAAAAPAAKPPVSPPASTQPKSVILMIGDGMGPEHTELGRLYKGSALPIETLPWQTQSMLDTTSLSGITWSCAAATALATGYATYNNIVGMSPDASGTLVSRENALEAAQALGKASGLVTDVFIEDATPAGFSAHVPDRGLTDEIAAQQVAHHPQVIFGAHAQKLATYQGQANVTYSSSLKDLQPYLDGKKQWPASLWGFYGVNSLAYDIDREEEGVVGKEPTLPQLTNAALGVVSKDSDGFFLMVEGGAIDWTAHGRDAAATAIEVVNFNSAIQVAWDYVQKHPDTLLVVTSDHETGGLGVDPNTVNVGAMRLQTASIEWMWGLIKANVTDAVITSTLKQCAGFTPTAADVRMVKDYGEMGISDVLADRDGVTWGWGGHDDGDHTATPVAVRAYGPGSAVFAAPAGGGLWPNEHVGKSLLGDFGVFVPGI
jgi:alkaline phosphatase